MGRHYCTVISFFVQKREGLLEFFSQKLHSALGRRWVASVAWRRSIRTRVSSRYLPATMKCTFTRLRESCCGDREVLY